eukprot:TRINITY_DN9128_c0_g1_i1.p1 TRINITY_DN9128_c0_g1~~TRINITY_DN9128_c0_g1_i1.p1  ORF type:complete len:322 (-),score=14.74 TRINITY_DN9128_c0_g1_i1:298-1263(-)
MSRARVSTRYWCHQCMRGFHLGPESVLGCPFCDGEFVEEIPSLDTPLPPPPVSSSANQPESLEMVDAMHALMNHFYGRQRRHHHHHHHHHHGHRHEIPEGLVFLRGLMDEEGGVEVFMSRRARGRTGYTLDQVVEHLARQAPSCGPPPAARSAVEALPTVRISAKHLRGGNNTCAVCTDDFEIGGEAKEMPCRHVYHADCILPWLRQHNSCPICRHELPSEDPAYDRRRARGEEAESDEEHQLGLTIWGLPGGNIAVSRYPGIVIGNSSSPNSSPYGNGDGNMAGSGSGATRRRGFWSSLWPFRSRSSSFRNGRHGRWLFS